MDAPFQVALPWRLGGEKELAALVDGVRRDVHAISSLRKLAPLVQSDMSLSSLHVMQAELDKLTPASPMVVLQMKSVREAAAIIEAASVQRLLMVREVEDTSAAIHAAHPQIGARQADLKARRLDKSKELGACVVGVVDAALKQLEASKAALGEATRAFHEALQHIEQGADDADDAEAQAARKAKEQTALVASHTTSLAASASGLVAMGLLDELNSRIYSMPPKAITDEIQLRLGQRAAVLDDQREQLAAANEAPPAASTTLVAGSGTFVTHTAGERAGVLAAAKAECEVLEGERAKLLEAKGGVETALAEAKAAAAKAEAASDAARYLTSKEALLRKHLKVLDAALALADDELGAVTSGRALYAEAYELEAKQSSIVDMSVQSAALMKEALTASSPGAELWATTKKKVVPKFDAESFRSATAGGADAKGGGSVLAAAGISFQNATGAGADGAEGGMRSIWQSLDRHYADRLRQLGVSGLRKYVPGQQLVVKVGGEQWLDGDAWIDAEVTTAPSEGVHSQLSMHRLRAEGNGTEFNLALTPFNHAPRELARDSFFSLWKRHCRSMRTQHATIIDALSGRRLDSLGHCVPIELRPADAADTSASFKKGGKEEVLVDNVNALSEWLHMLHARRLDGSNVEAPVCVLVTAGPAAGKTCLMSQLVMHVVLRNAPPADAIDDKTSTWAPAHDDLVPILIRIQDLQKRLLADEASFARAWNWVDAYLCALHGRHSEMYRFLRQALMARRAVLLLDGIDEAGKARDVIERHVSEVLAPQGHVLIVTSRPNGVRQELFSTTGYHHLELRALTDAQQADVVERRLMRVATDKTGAKRAAVLMEYIRTKVPLDADTGMRVTGNPLMLSMVVSIFESRQQAAAEAAAMSLTSKDAKDAKDAKGETKAEADKKKAGGKEDEKIEMPRSVVELYQVASTTMLDRLERKERSDTAPRGIIPIPHLRKLLEAAFFQAHAAERRILRRGDLETAALGLSNPEELKAIQLRTSGPEGRDERAAAVKAACKQLPAARQEEVSGICERVRQDRLPLLSLISALPIEMQSSHLSFQEFFCAQAICKGYALPPEASAPWCWSPWWGNTLRLGNEIGKEFETGLLNASAEAGTTMLNLRAHVGGHRPTSFTAIGLLLRAVVSVDLRDNRINDEEAVVIADAMSRTESLTKLNMAGNRISSTGAKAIGLALAASTSRVRSVSELDLSRNPLCVVEKGAGEKGSAAAPKEKADDKAAAAAAAAAALGGEGENLADVGVLELGRAVSVCASVSALFLTHGEMSDSAGAKFLLQFAANRTRRSSWATGGTLMAAKLKDASKGKEIKSVGDAALALLGKPAHAAPSLLPVGEQLRQLSKLDLSCNALSMSFAENLGKFLAVSPLLSHLSLPHNRLGIGGGVEVAKALKSASALKFLDLSYNNICGCTPAYGKGGRSEWSGEAITAITEAMLGGATLQELWLHGNGVCGMWADRICGEEMSRGTYTAAGIDALIRMLEQERLPFKPPIPATRYLGGLRLEIDNLLRSADKARFEEIGPPSPCPLIHSPPPAPSDS